jgi:hypothetical protein
MLTIGRGGTVMFIPLAKAWIIAKLTHEDAMKKYRKWCKTNKGDIYSN